MASTFPDLPIFRAIASHDPKSVSLIDCVTDQHFTYGQLLRDVEIAKIKLYHELKATIGDDESVGGQRVAILVENGYDYVVNLLSVFACDSIAVPLSSSFPATELKYMLDHSQSVLLLSSTTFQTKAEEILRTGLERKPVLSLIERKVHDEAEDQVTLVPLSLTKGGVMLYTSGTTSRPKGVVLRTSTLTAQAESLLKAWRYTTNDHVLHVLPLHHIHGMVNALIAPLFAGSTVEMMFPFNADAVWKRFAAPFAQEDQRSLEAPSTTKSPISFFTAVPTIYNRLISSYERLPTPLQIAVKMGLASKHLRLNISGSASLPVPIKQQWTELSEGNELLERYGMTEVGMALSCGLDFRDRVDGSVGWPLPSVDVRLVDTETNEVIERGREMDESGKERDGEIQLRGPTIFDEYWRDEKATASEFVAAEDGRGKWFKTGDIATRRDVDGTGMSEQEWASGPMYFIRGRRSTDIIKTGGEKVSALEVERELLSLPQVLDAAVVGVPNEQWGQKVSAVLVLKPAHAQTGKGGKAWGVMDMRRALKDKLASYKIPQDVKMVDELPKNAMGKVNKKSLVQDIFPAIP